MQIRQTTQRSRRLEYRQAGPRTQWSRPILSADFPNRLRLLYHCREHKLVFDTYCCTAHFAETAVPLGKTLRQLAQTVEQQIHLWRRLPDSIEADSADRVRGFLGQLRYHAKAAAAQGYLEESLLYLFLRRINLLERVIAGLQVRASLNSSRIAEKDSHE